MNLSKTLRGIVEGDSVPDIFIPKLIELYKQGRLPFDRMVRFYEFDEIGKSFEDSSQGIAVKPVIRMPDLCP